MTVGETRFVFRADPAAELTRSMTGIPTPRLMGEKIRIYYYARDSRGDGRIFYLDLDLREPSRILYVHPEPVLDIGAPGDFDDCGVCPSCFVEINGRRFLHYFGVQRSEKVPYLYFGGLAEENVDGSFARTSRVPLLERTSNEPHLRSASTVIRFGSAWKMWYVAGSGWFSNGGKQYPRYSLRAAISADGLQWRQLEEPVIALVGDEFGFGRPWALESHGAFHLFYSIRSLRRPYRLGYARSSDGVHWERADETLALSAEPGSWNEEMSCYPAVLETPAGAYLFFNGNGYGATGFGYARIAL